MWQGKETTSQKEIQAEKKALLPLGKKRFIWGYADYYLFKQHRKLFKQRLKRRLKIIACPGYNWIRDTKQPIKAGCYIVYTLVVVYAIIQVTCDLYLINPVHRQLTTTYPEDKQVLKNYPAKQTYHFAQIGAYKENHHIYYIYQTVVHNQLHLDKYKKQHGSLKLVQHENILPMIKHHQWTWYNTLQVYSDKKFAKQANLKINSQKGIIKTNKQTYLVKRDAYQITGFYNSNNHKKVSAKPTKNFYLQDLDALTYFYKARINSKNYQVKQLTVIHNHLYLDLYNQQTHQIKRIQYLGNNLKKLF